MECLDRIIHVVKDMGTRFAKAEAVSFCEAASTCPGDNDIICSSERASKSFWTNDLTEFARTNELPTECQVLVIGAGLSGVRLTFQHPFT